MNFSGTQIKVGKIIVSATWLVIIAAYLLPETIPVSNLFVGLGAFLIIAHVIETIVYRTRLARLSDYLGVLLFGLLHIRQLAIQFQKAGK